MNCVNYSLILGIYFLTSVGVQGEDIQLFSVTVGKKPSSAFAYVDDTAAVLEVLEALNRVSRGIRNWNSSLDLQNSEFQYYSPSPSGKIVNSLRSPNSSGKRAFGGRAVSMDNLSGQICTSSKSVDSADSDSKFNAAMIGISEDSTDEPSNSENLFITRTQSSAHISMSDWMSTW